MYNEEMKDEILVTRRATYKAEEAVSGLEKDKGRQDLFIDRLMEQARWVEVVSIKGARIQFRGIQATDYFPRIRQTRQECGRNDCLVSGINDADL